MNQDRFPSLVELQQAHDELSRRQASTGRAAPDPARVAEFIRRAVATGTVLDSREERSVAQSLTNFWAKRLKASTRGPAPTDGTNSSTATDRMLGTEALPRPSPARPAAPPDAWPSPAPSDSAPAGDPPLSESALAGDSALATEKSPGRAADGDLIEDTLLAEYDSGTLGDSAAAADRVIDALSPEDADLARQLVLRLVRLRPEGKKFDAIPTSRAAMQTYGDPAAVDRMIGRLAATGVVRVTPGENPLADRIGLRSIELRGVWPRLDEWMNDRIAFRDRASAPPPEPGISRFLDYVVTWLTKQLASVSRFFVRLRRRVAPTPTTELSERELDDAEAYHDHNARESDYLRRVRDRRRRLNEANRVLVCLATIMFAFALLGWWRAQSQAKLANENADVANENADVAFRQAELAKANENWAAAETERARKAADAAEAQRQIADDRLKLSSLRQVCRAWADVINARGEEQRQIAKYRWNSLVAQDIVKGSLAGSVNLEQLWTFADEAYKQQNAPPGGTPKNPTEGYHLQLMREIKKLRNELLGCESMRPALDTARRVAFSTVNFCIEHVNDLLIERKRPYGDAAPYIREFWSQYWGDMILVEGTDVAIAMENYGKVLNDLRDFAVGPAPAPPPAGRATAPPREASAAKKGFPAELLNKLRAVHDELRGKLAAEGEKPLADVLKN